MIPLYKDFRMPSVYRGCTKLFIYRGFANHQGHCKATLYRRLPLFVYRTDLQSKFICVTPTRILWSTGLKMSFWKLHEMSRFIRKLFFNTPNHFGGLIY